MTLPGPVSSMPSPMLSPSEPSDASAQFVFGPVMLLSQMYESLVPSPYALMPEPGVVIVQPRTTIPWLSSSLTRSRIASPSSQTYERPSRRTWPLMIAPPGVCDLITIGICAVPLRGAVNP